MKASASSAPRPLPPSPPPPATALTSAALLHHLVLLVVLLLFSLSPLTSQGSGGREDDVVVCDGFRHGVAGLATVGRPGLQRQQPQRTLPVGSAAAPLHRHFGLFPRMICYTFPLFSHWINRLLTVQ